MKLFLTILLLVTLNVHGELTKEQQNKIADAIYRAEGGAKAKTPYGVSNVKSKGKARQACLASIRNNYARWEEAGKPQDFITFMGRRYCPPSEHSLNKNWARNVRKALGKEFVDTLARDLHN